MSLPINQIICGDCIEVIKTFPDESIDLVVTSPPYNIGKEYEERILTNKEYYNLIFESFLSIKRILKKDGRICFNVPFSMNRRGQIFYIFPIVLKAFQDSSLNIRDLIIWDQMYSGSNTAWGSWKSPSSPWLRHLTELILLGYKSIWKKEKKGKSDLETKEFMGWTLDKWRFSANTGLRKKHPTAFPEELPIRCIKLFSYIDDIILDPFVGSGTTCVVAQKLGRRWIGIDVSSEYCNIARQRLSEING